MSASVRELAIEFPGAPAMRAPLSGNRVTVGRSSAADLSFPEDAGLSRQHFALEAEGNDWTIEDLGSRNGTCVNKIKLNGKLILRPGDRITAGRLTIVYAPDEARAGGPGPVEFAEGGPVSPMNTVFTSLQVSAKDIEQESAGRRGARDRSTVQALIAAGHALAEHRPLAELFPALLDMSAQAAGAQRGVLMTLEEGGLSLRAQKGAGFRISTFVRDKVLNERASILVRDAQEEEAFRARASIIEQRVRTMMAAPLQTEERAIGLIYLDSPFAVREFTKEDLNLLTVIANVAAVRIENARLAEIEAAGRIIQRDLSQAAEIQQAVLSARAPGIPGADIAGFNAACRTVGGDYYGFFAHPGARAGMALGDVSGKGMPAALMMMALHARVSVLAEEPGDLGVFLSRLNKATCADCPSNRFITFFFCVLDGATGELAYANAGHNPPILVRASGEAALLEGGGPVLGVLKMAAYREMRAQLWPGDLLALYTDGVTEAADASGEEFGEKRLMETLARHREEPAESIVEAVRSAVAEFAAGAPQTDDITVVIAKRK